MGPLNHLILATIHALYVGLDIAIFFVAVSLCARRWPRKLFLAFQAAGQKVTELVLEGLRRCCGATDNDPADETPQLLVCLAALVALRLAVACLVGALLN